MENYSVIITGASSGIGRQIAEDFSKLGAECLLVGRNADRLHSLAASLGSRTHVRSCDFQNTQEIQKLVEEISGPSSPLKKPLKALINNAGIVLRNKVETTPLSDWKDQFQTNIFAPVQLTQGLLPLLKKNKESSIVNISSTLGIKPIPETSAYSASKGAVNSWTQALALELAPHGVRANAICPGIVETPIHNFPDDDEVKKQFDKMQPMGRMGQPKDISSMAVFLCSEASAWTTGSVFVVDGGISLNG